MLRNAAFASSVVASIPIVLPLTKSAVASTCRIQVKTARCVSRSIRRRVREIVECSGGISSRPSPRKPRSASESAVRHANAALGIDPFEVADQEQPEVRAGCQTGSAMRRVERRALRLDEVIEAVCVEERIQSLIKRMPDGPRQIVRRDPQSWRVSLILPTTHGHAAV